MTKGERLAAAALQYLDAPFRLHGRNPETGLDCVGLLLASLDAVDLHGSPPCGYGLRNHTADRWLALAPQWGLADAGGPILPGDVLVSRPGPLQHHIMIVLDDHKVIHAHSGLRRVVREPLGKSATVIRHWRLDD